MGSSRSIAINAMILHTLILGWLLKQVFVEEPICDHLRLLNKRTAVVRNLLTFKMADGKPNVMEVLGGPGAGKGTQCAKIVEQFGHVHLSAGDLLRAERASPGSQYGELIEHHITNGTIVPVEITCSLLERAMTESDKNNFLIDGFPRNEDNLQGWTKVMGDKVNMQCVL